MIFKPYAYQTYCINKIVEQNKIGLFLDMGLGKTVTTLTAIMELKYNMFSVNRVLVIAPKKVAESTWSREAAKWDHTKLLRVSKVMGAKAVREKALEADADIYVINRDNVKWLVDYLKNSWSFDMVVIDESSSFKDPSTHRFKAIRRVLPRINRLVELTGTPSPNGLMDLWAQIFLLDSGERLGRTLTGYRERYFTPDKRGPNGQVFSWKLKKDSDKAILKKLNDICVSMKAEDYLELPELIENDIVVELDPKARKSYETMERDLILNLPEGEVDALSAAALSTKLLQISNGAVYDEDRAILPIHDCKIDAFMELIESLQGRPALVFYAYQHDKERILKAAAKKKIRCRVLEDDHDIDLWNMGELNILLAHPASAAYGLNLQEGGHDVIWFGLTWNYEQYVQANKRLHRQGQKSTVIVHRLISAGTRDEDVIKALERKDDAQNEVMNSLKARIERVRH